MMKDGKKWVLLSLVLLAAFFWGSAASAQTYWMYPGETNTISLEVHKPKFDRAEGFGTLTTIWFLSGRFRAGDKLSVCLDMPVSNVDIDKTVHPTHDDETLFGNPYFGIEGRLSELDAPHIITARLGLRPPLASDEKMGAADIGFFTAYDRFEALIPDWWTVQGGFGYSRTLEGGIKYSVNIDGNLILPTEDGPDNELLLNYNLAFLFPVEKVSFGAGFNGRWLVTESDLDFGQATIHQLGFVGKYDFGQFSPGLHLRIPIDEDLSDIIDYMYGFNLTYHLK